LRWSSDVKLQQVQFTGTHHGPTRLCLMGARRSYSPLGISSTSGRLTLRPGWRSLITTGTYTWPPSQLYQLVIVTAVDGDSLLTETAKRFTSDSRTYHARRCILLNERLSRHRYKSPSTGTLLHIFVTSFISSCLITNVFMCPCVSVYRKKQ